jgi:hypothetical protein
MAGYDNLYCKIFIDTDADRDYVKRQIARILSGSIDFWTIVTEFGEFDIRKNSDFDEEKRDKPKGFLFSRYYLDIDILEGTEQEFYISSIAKLLQGLWDLGYKAIAACDFEDKLPKRNWV